MPTLNEIETELRNTILEMEQWCKENETDELPEHLLERLYVNEDELTDKMESYRAAISGLRGNAQYYDEQQKIYAAKKKQALRTIERLKERLKIAVLEFGAPNAKGNPTTEINGQSYTVVTSKSVALQDGILPSELPEDCKTTKVTVTPNKKQLKKLLEHGQAPDGVFFEEKQSLRVGNKNL